MARPGEGTEGVPSLCTEFQTHHQVIKYKSKLMFSTCPKHSDCQKPKQSEDTHAGNDCRENATERTFPHPSSAAPQGVLPAGDMSQRDAKGSGSHTAWQELGNHRDLDF